MRRTVIEPRLTEWMPTIRRQLKRGSTCFVLSVEYLVGDRGLLSRIKRRGTRVIRVVR